MTSREPSLQNNLKFEERTNAITPDKLDRSARGRKVAKDEKPYPLTEEEATPSVPESEKKLK
ncbi:MAG: hypothetical protein ACYC7D_14585 [Nitrososphaerales archaeon]